MSLQSLYKNLQMMVHFSACVIYLSDFTELVGNQLTQPVKVHKRAPTEEGVKEKQMNTLLAQNQDVKNKINQGTKKLEQKYSSCLYMNGRKLDNKKEKLELELLFYDLASITDT